MRTETAAFAAIFAALILVVVLAFAGVFGPLTDDGTVCYNVTDGTSVGLVCE